MANQEPSGGNPDRKRQAAIRAALGEVHPGLDRSSERQQEEREKAIEWLAEKWTQDRACPICGVTDWKVADVTEISLFGLSDRVYPLMPVICQNCFYVHLFHAIQIGVIPNEDLPDPPKD